MGKKIYIKMTVVGYYHILEVAVSPYIKLMFLAIYFLYKQNEYQLF